MLGKIEMRPGLVKKSQGWYSGGGVSSAGLIQDLG